MKKFLFALVLFIPFFFKLDTFAFSYDDYDIVIQNRSFPNRFICLKLFPEHHNVFHNYYRSFVDYNWCFECTDASGTLLYFYVHYYIDDTLISEAGHRVYAVGNDYLNGNVVKGVIYNNRNDALNHLFIYDPSIKPLKLWKNSFTLLNDTICYLGWSFPSLIASKDYSSIDFTIYVNGSPVDILHRTYPNLWSGALIDTISFKYSDYNISSSDNIQVIAHPLKGNKYGDDIVINWNGSHGGGGSSRIDTTIDIPSDLPNPNKPIKTVIDPQPNKVVLPVGVTPTTTTVTTPTGDTVTYNYDSTTNQYSYEYNYYTQDYTIDLNLDLDPEFAAYFEQVIRLLTELNDKGSDSTTINNNYNSNVSSGDTITNITNNYNYTYNYNYDFDVDFGDLTVEQQDLKSFIQDFPSFSEKYISFLSSFGIPVWLVVLIVSCFGLIFVVLLIKIAKLVLPV